MVQSPSWEANWSAASQEIPRISRKPKVHYRTHKRPPPVSILGQPNPVHVHTTHLLEIRSNIIRPSTPRSPQWSPSLRFPHQDPIHPPLLTHTCHMPSQSHYITPIPLTTVTVQFVRTIPEGVRQLSKWKNDHTANKKANPNHFQRPLFLTTYTFEVHLNVTLTSLSVLVIDQLNAQILVL